MSLVGSYSVPGPSSSVTYSEEYNSIDELLTQLIDNTSNSIVAQDIRDSVLSIWRRIDYVETIAITAASASTGVLYTNALPTTQTVGGITVGTTFPTAQTMEDMWNALLYPYIAPSASLSIATNVTREYGSPTALTLNWSVVRNLNSITSIIVDSVPQAYTGNSQSGTKLATATHSVTPLSPTASQSYVMSVSDGTSTPTVSTSLIWSTRIYWGRINFISIGNPNLSTNPGSASLCATLATDAVIESLSGANANSQAFGSELASTKSKTYSNMDGSGQYLIFAWPSIVSTPYTPTFTVNGLISTAFTRIRTNSSFYRSFYGYSGINYEVWVSNTVQNSPLNIIIS